MIRDQILAALHRALDAAGFPVPEGGVELTPPTQAGHGDFTTNVAMRLAKSVGMPPREVAAKIVVALEAERPPHLERVESSGPGFINLYLAPTWLHDVLRGVVAQGEHYGHSRARSGHRINLEFVSLNPTGPIHAGGRALGRGRRRARQPARGAGRRGAPRVLPERLREPARHVRGVADRALSGEEPPDDGYHGEYLVEMADQMRAALGDAATEEQAREWGYRWAVEGVRHDLDRIGVQFDTWFSERTLHESGAVAEVLADLRNRGFVYEQDGATWLRSTAFGDQRDRVLVKSDGDSTYLLADLAYHRDKFERGWEHLIDIWGADHHGQVKSIQAGMEALGYPAGEPEVLLGQLVKLERGGQLVRLSRRAGNIITLADILDEVDPDVARLTFLLQSIDTTQTFDLDLVTAQSMDNPVYYVQYAHARIASIGRRAAERGITRLPILDVNLAPLTHERELDLLRALSQYPDVLAEAAELRAPHRVATWVRDFAKSFHGFYRDCRVISDDVALTQARLWLAEACRLGLASALAILGVHAPDEMTRADPDEPDPDEPDPDEPDDE